VVLGVDGIPDFNALHSRQHEEEVQLYAFDIMALDGEDLRALPLSLRKTNLARLLARRPDGIFVAPFEQGEIGPDLFRAACNMGLEGLVSKRVDRPYRGGRSPDWVKVKNRKHPAMERVKDAFA
jgi:ATP-dependent DNA ligase